MIIALSNILLLFILIFSLYCVFNDKKDDELSEEDYEEDSFYDDDDWF